MLNPTSIISARAVRKASRRRGSMMVYCIFIMLVSCAMIFLAVDYGRLQMIKSQEQRSADSLARGLLTTLLVQQPTIKAYGMTNAQAAPYLVSMGVAAKIEAAARQHKLNTVESFRAWQQANESS